MKKASALDGAQAGVADCEFRGPSMFRRFVETVVLFITFVILLRALALEPFGVPTGSMAMTLVGNHKSCACPRCGFLVLVGSGNIAQKPLRDPYRHARCPNCGEAKLPMNAEREVGGDRLLVDKNVFELREPRRWEVAVFRCPSDGNKPYVKRIVGLPGEQVLIHGGDVYANGVLARKSLSECRAVRIPLFDSAFPPRDRTWKVRWLAAPPALSAPPATQEAGMSAADPFVDGADLKWPASDQLHFVVHRNWLFDENQEDVFRDDFAYNGASLPHRLAAVHDFGVEFELEAGVGAGTFVVGLRDGHDDLNLELALGAGRTRLLGKEGKVLADSTLALSPGKRHRLEFYFFDRRAVLIVNGREAFPPVDLPPVSHREPVSRPFWLAGRGPTFLVRNLRLFRDIHYASTGGECRNGVFEPWPLGPEEYFVLGDNSSNSQDSRFWTDAGIPRQCFLGKPLLLHQPSHWTKWGNWEIESIHWQRVRWIR